MAEPPPPPPVAEPPAIPYDRARREGEEWAAAVVAVACLGVNASRAGKEPPPQWIAMLGEVTDHDQDAVAALNVASAAADQRPPSPKTP